MEIAPNNIKKIDQNIESLRGYAAISVVFNHIFHYNEYLDPKYFPKFLKFFTPPGHLSVLVFFLLSGYVIEMSHNEKRALTKYNIVNYLKKRIVRLYPIYFLTIIATLLIINNKYPFSVILSNLIFAQNLLSPTINEIDPIWSLNYEVLFYLLFIPISLVNANPIKIITVSIILVFIVFFLDTPFCALSASYLIGFVFWLSGLAIARYLKKSNKEIDKILLLSNIFLFLSLPTLIDNLVGYLFSSEYGRMLINFPNDYRVKINNLFLLPYCFLFMSNFTNRTFLNKKLFAIILQLAPIIAFYPVALIILEKHYTLIFGIIAYILSTLLFFLKSDVSNFVRRTTNYIFKVGSWFGGISYAVYITHFPILIIFSKITLFSGTNLSYMIRFLLFISFTVVVSYILEKSYQPFFNKLFFHANKPKQ